MKRYILWLALACVIGGSIHPATAGDGRSTMDRSWVVVPGVAVGPVRIGMSQADVRAAVGEPERTSLGAWEYLSGGFAVTFSPSRHTVTAILGGNAGDPHGALVKAFVARTAEGIGMGSTRSAAVRSLGEPEADRIDQGGEVLSYHHLGLELMLVADSVAHLSIWRPSHR